MHVVIWSPDASSELKAVMPWALLGELWVSGYGPLDHSFQGAGQTGDHTGSDTAFQKGNSKICEASGKDHQK